MKREEFYKLIKVYEKIKEVRTFRHNIFILQYCNNFPSDNNNNEENKIKNNLEQCKSDIMEIMRVIDQMSSNKDARIFYAFAQKYSPRKICQILNNRSCSDF